MSIPSHVSSTYKRLVVLGVDPGLAFTGWGVVERTQTGPGRCRTIDYGVIETKANENKGDRLKKIYQGLQAVIDKYNPNLVAIEEVFFGKNAKTAMMVGEAKGVIVLTAVIASVQIQEFTPLEIKIAITGFGRAEKKQMQEMVQKLLGLEKIPKPDHAADALAAAITAIVTKLWS